MTAKISLVFFRTFGGSEPVRDWLKALLPEDRRIIGQDLQRLQYRWPVGMPLARALSKGLWEVRANCASDLLLSRGRACCAQRIHKEKPEDAEERT
jgi:hypothetical protein